MTGDAPPTGRDFPPVNAKPAADFLDSQSLLEGRREVIIVHHGERYRLLVTRNNKLMLQK
jgi:hemin uptake protein HemP